MDASSCPSRLIPFLTTSTASFLLVLLWHLALLSLPLLVRAQYSNNPSTDWALADFYDISNSLQNYNYRNFTVCNNGSSNLELLNDAQGLYGRPTSILSAHFYMPYTVYFSFYFVTPADNVCMKDNVELNETIPAYYLSLVALNGFVKTPDPNKGQVVWTANPMTPVTKNACLRLDDSNLTLLDHQDNIGSSPQVIWQIGAGASDVSLVISFEGNLVLLSNTTDTPYVPLRESFGQPTDTLMVLQVLQNNSTLTVNSSATSNTGNYTLALEKGRLVLYAKIGPPLGDEESPYGSPYWFFPNSSVPADDNIAFAAFCWDSVHQLRLIAGSNRSSNVSTGYKGIVSPEFCSTIPNTSGTAMQITGLNQLIDATFATFLRLEADGDLRAYTVDNTTYPDSNANATWRAFYNVFNSTPCALPLYCGSYGMCSSDGENPRCRCDYNQDPKLVFADASDTKSGCNPENGGAAQLWDIHNISSSAQDCANNITACGVKDTSCDVEFFQLGNVSYFSLTFSNSYHGVQDSDGCRGECEKNCSCTAAFWNQSTTSCVLVLGRLGTIQQQGTMQAFIKYLKITKNPQTSTSPFNVVVIAPVLAATFLLVLVLCIFLGYCRTRRAHKMSELRKQRLLLLSMLDGANTEQFTWKQIHEYTCGFSDILGGGGFGRVFRGALPDGTAIAVKQLDVDRSQGQGDKEFIAEVSILSRIHHAHLVRLIGFCSEGSHRLLVYEYMENGSLDAWLFKKHAPLMLQERQFMDEKADGNTLLPWKTRFQIAVGTAKGLAYLHEECEERVIHMDLKPQNILLGRNFQAKISDFGMSRRTAREQSSVMTVMRGTPGYLAPEWLVDAAITEKCDVYSFGIMLLEIVSGRKVKDVRALKRKLSMRPLRESVMLDFLDDSLRYDTSYGSDVNEKEAVRMVEVALLCARTDPMKRPAMSSVALMLEGREEVAQDVLDDGEDGEQQQLVTYPSGMNRTMRMLQQQGKLESFASSLTDSISSGVRCNTSSKSFWSSSDDNNIDSSYKKKYFNIDHNKFQRKAASFFDRDASSSAEWDRLLQN